MLLLTRLSVRRANVEVEVLRRTKDHPGDGRRIALPVRKCSANEGKTNRFARFQIKAAFAAVGPRIPLASGMAAREGEDPHAGLQRSRQPGPAGRRASPTRRFQEDLGAMIVSSTSFGLNTANGAGAGLISTTSSQCSLANSPWSNGRR